jgi:hypothetical protein
MEHRGYRPSLVGPLILISAGVLLLLNQMGRLPWSVWGTLWRFWPVILILAGLEVLVGVSRSRILYVFGVLIAIVVLGSVIGYAVYRGAAVPGPWPAARTEEVLEALQDADRGRVTLRFGAGELVIGALVDSPSFASGKIEYARYSRQAEQDFRVRDGTAEFSLQAGSQPIPFWRPGDGAGERWNIEFTPRIPLEMAVSRGVGGVNLDLTRLKVTELDVGGGVGETIVTFPAAAGSTRASVKAAIGDITVKIPDGVGAKIHVSKLLASVDVMNQRFVRSGDEYVSTNYDTAENKLDVEINLVIGDIIIR